MRRALALSFVLLAAFATESFAGRGRIVIVNNDAPGVGLNDPTPVAPVGGNSGTTLGEQRMNVYQAAADQWSARLDTDIDILAQAGFAALECDATSAILGQARPIKFIDNFTNAPEANTWYPIALANALAKKDLAVGQPDIFMQFNSAIDNAQCLGDSGWYYGLDGNHGDDTDLFVVVMHELAHGLGVSAPSGDEAFFLNKPSVFDTHALDLSSGRRWTQMSEAQRKASLTNSGNLVWDGENVRSHVARFLQPVTTLTVTAPAAVARNFDIGTATFGPEASRAAMTGTMVRALDVANPNDGPTTFDGCTAFTNASAVAGQIALIDRGSCLFVTKARNAQAAGAIGVVIVDNSTTNCTPPGMSGDAPDVTIPIVSITARDGDALKQQLSANASVSSMLRVDPSQLAGTTQQGYMRLYAPCTAEPGSSKHHWDVVSTPNLLMEPAVNDDLLHGVDLTLYQLLDLGWKEAPRSGRRALRR